MSRKHVTPPSTSPQTHPLASPVALRSDRRWWPFTDAGAAAAAAAAVAADEHREETGTNVKFDSCIGSSSRPLPLAMSPAAVSGDHRLPFRWRHGGSGRDFVFGYPGSSSKITTRSSDPVVIDDGQPLEVPYVRTCSFIWGLQTALASPRSVQLIITDTPHCMCDHFSHRIRSTS